MAGSIKGVAFDLDGTLYPNILMYLYTAPLFLTRPFFIFHFGKIRRNIRTIRPIDDFRALQAELLSVSMGISREKARMKIDRVIYGTWEHSFRFMLLYPGIRSLLANIRSMGIKTGVLSDYPVRQKLAHFGLSRYWDVAMCSDESGYLKPHPEPFLLLARRMDLPPEQILYIGNSYTHDVLGASNAGMKTAWLTWKSWKTGADTTYLWYKQLERYIIGHI